MIPLGGWEPDKPDFRGPGLTVARNILPREDGTYGPIGDLTQLSGGLGSACLGLGSAKSNSGDYLTFGGTATRLFKLESTNSWTDVSNPSFYSLNALDRWRFSAFGNTLVVVGGVETNLQAYDLALSSQFADLSATAPRAKYLAVVGNFLMVCNTWDGSDGYLRNRVWWSAIGNAASWPTPGSDAAATVQSGRAELRDGGDIQGILPGIGGLAAAIFGENRIWMVSYEGPPTVFRFDAVERARGVYAPGSLISNGKIAYYLSEDGFYAFDGVQSVPIGAGKVDRWFLNDLDDSARDRITAASIPDQKIIIWSYPGTGWSGDRCNRMIAYNWVSQQFTEIRANAELIATARSPGYTLETLDSLGYTLDELPFSLDSRVWAGGAPIFAVFLDGAMYSLSGSNKLQATLKTNEFAGQGNARMFVSGVLPYTDASDITAAIGFKHSEFDTETMSTYRSPGVDRIIPFRHPARRASLTFSIPYGASWTSIQGYDVKSKPEGYR